MLIFYRKRLLTAVRERREGTETDPHILGMQKYADVPLWAYGILAVLAFFAGLIAVLHGQTTLPVWAYIVGLLLGGIIAPFSMSLYARLGDGIGCVELRHAAQSLADVPLAAPMRCRA